MLTARAALSGGIDSRPAVIVESESGPVASAALAFGTEPSTGMWQVWLRHLRLAKKADRVACLKLLAKQAVLQSPPPEGWLALELPPDSPWEIAAEELHFTPLDLRLTLPLNKARPPSPKWRVRQARHDDLEEIQSLTQSSLSQVLRRPPGVPIQTVIEYAGPRYPSVSAQTLEDPYSDCWVLENSAGSFAGFLLISSAQIENIAITPECRGHRGAHALLQHAAWELCRGGIEALEASVAAANPRSWKSALRAGFKLVSRRWVKRF